jgi:glycosyltransferase involved in cell wall biosynthesis
MPLIVVDARGITFRPSGARTRLLGLYSALAEAPGPLEFVVVVSQDRRAREICHARNIPCIETPPERVGRKLFSGFRLTGDPFRWADIIHRETYPVPIDQPQPTVLTIHDLRSSADRSMATTPMKSFYERRLLPLAAKRLSRLVAVSETTARDIVHYLRVRQDRLVVVPNAIDPPELTSEVLVHPLNGERFMLAFGHMEPRKNLPSLLPAMQTACKDANFPVRNLIIAGRDFGEAERLRAQMNKITNPGFQLHILTEVDDELRESLLHHADCLLAPSRLEGFGLVPLEAMIRNTPALVSDIPAAREVLSDAALYFNPAEPASLSDSLRDIVLDQSIAERLNKAATSVLEKYSWKRSAKILMETYCSILGTNPVTEESCRSSMTN